MGPLYRSRLASLQRCPYHQFTHQSFSPSMVTEKTASPSGRLSESSNLAMRFSPLDFRRYNLKVEVCPSTWLPAGCDHSLLYRLSIISLAESMFALDQQLSRYQENLERDCCKNVFRRIIFANIYNTYGFHAFT